MILFGPFWRSYTGQIYGRNPAPVLFQTVSSTTAAVRHRRWLLDCGNDSVWLASDGVFASATSVEILLFALTASMSNEPTGDALPTRSGAKGRLRIPLLSLPQAYSADEGVRQ